MPPVHLCPWRLLISRLCSSLEHGLLLPRGLDGVYLDLAEAGLLERLEGAFRLCRTSLTCKFCVQHKQNF